MGDSQTLKKDPDYTIIQIMQPECPSRMKYVDHLRRPKTTKLDTKPAAQP